MFILCKISSIINNKLEAFFIFLVQGVTYFHKYLLIHLQNLNTLFQTKDSNVKLSRSKMNNKKDNSTNRPITNNQNFS